MLENTLSSSVLLSLASVSVKGRLILVATIVTTHLLGRSAARVRHIVWAVAMIGLLIVPALSLVTPEWRVGLLPSADPTPQGATSVNNQSGVPTPAAARLTTPPVGGFASTHVATAETSGPSLWQTLSGVAWIVGLWIGGALLLMGSLLRGLTRARSLRQHAALANDGEWAELLDSCRATAGVARAVELRISDEVTAPMTWGIRHPVILLPDAAWAWTRERRRVVLLHELVHIQRNDWVVHIVARLACVTYWFNPLVWMGAGRMSIEREKACDDGVIATGAKPSDYAQHLLDIARSVAASPRVPAAALTMARLNQLEGRLVSILTPKNKSKSRAVWMPVIIMATVIVGLASLEPWRDAPKASITPSMTQSIEQVEPPREPMPDPAPPSDAEPVARPEPLVSPEPVGEPAGVATIQHGPDGGRDRYRYSSGEDEHFVFEQDIEDMSLSMRVEGQVDFSRDGTRIEHMSRDASVFIEAKEDGTQYALEITGEGADLEYDWQINGKQEAMNDDAKAWMTSALVICHAHLEMAALQGQLHSMQGEIHSIFGERHSLEGEVHSIHGERHSLEVEINAILGEHNSVLGRLHGLEAEKHDLDVERRVKEFNAQIEALEVSEHVAELEVRIAELDVDGKIRAVEERVQPHYKEMRERMRAMKR